MDEGKKRAADLLRRFVQGRGHAWEFDDFLSGKSGQGELERYRRELAELPLRYPPAAPSEYTSEAGIARILEIASELEQGD